MMLVMMGIPALLLLAVIVLGVFGVVWLARRRAATGTTPADRQPRQEPGTATDDTSEGRTP